MAYDLQARKAELDKTLGIRQRTSGVNAAFSGSGVAPKSGGGNFFGNVAKSALKIPGQLISGATQQISKAFQNVGQGINQGLPIIGSIAQNQKAREQTLAQLKQFETGYHRQYAQGKIDKTRFNALLKDLNKEYAKVSGGSATEVETMVKPKEFVSGLATVGSLPFAAGKFAGDKSLTTGLQAGEKITSAALKAPLRYGLGVQPVAQAPVNIASNLKQGKVGAAALEAGLAAGAPLGFAALNKYGKPVGKAIRTAFTGEKTFFGEIAKKTGVNVVKYLDDTKSTKYNNIAKVMEDFNLEQFNGNAKAAADFVVRWQKDAGRDITKLSPQQLLDEMDELRQAVGQVRKLAKQGKLTFANGDQVLDSRGNIFVARFDASVKSNLVKELGKASSREERLAILSKMEDDGALWAQNKNLRSKIYEAVEVNHWDEIIKNITAATALKLPRGVKLPNGYFPIISENVSATFKSPKAIGEISRGKAPAPVLGAIGKGMKKLGVGLDDFEPEQFTIAKNNFISKHGDLAFSELVKLSDDKKVTDLRQLSIREIAGALNISNKQASVVRNDLDKAFRSVKLGIRSAGDKLQDTLVYNKYNPISRGYARVQSALRYTLNPSFKIQQVIEANTVGAIQGIKIGKVDDVVSKMRSSGLIPTSNTGFAGESMEGFKGLTKVTQRLMPMEEKALARTLAGIAEKRGVSVDSLLKDDNTRQLIRSIVQNPSKGALSSNFAKTLNLAIFPARYNIKVAGLAVKALAKQPPSVQFGVVKGLKDFSDYLKTDEGIKWYSENADLIQLVRYFTPVNSIISVYNALPGGEKASLRDLGAIGGLPFGVIARILEHQGAIDTQPPYVNPKTGEVAPDRIPQTTGARAKQALIDIIDYSFTFPGRQAGLGSKQDLIHTVTGGVLRPKKGEYKVEKKELSDKQKNLQRVLAPKQASGTSNKVTFKTLPQVKNQPLPSLPAKAKKTGRAGGSKRVKTVPARFRLN